jgi:hypothetical protein
VPRSRRGRDEAGAAAPTERVPREAGGTLILYDYVADRVHETPTAFPLRMPSSTVVRLARFKPTGPNRIRLVNWDCGENV